MHQVSAEVWNRIAESQELVTQFANRVFPLPEKDQEVQLRHESRDLERRGIPASVRAAYLLVMPLLWERAAISSFVAENPDLAPGLPNVEDVEEAVMLASRDLPLSESQQSELTKLLQAEPQ